MNVGVRKIIWQNVLCSVEFDSVADWMTPWESRKTELERVRERVKSCNIFCSSGSAVWIYVKSSDPPAGAVFGSTAGSL